MKQQKQETKKKPWRRPEIKEIEIRDTEGVSGSGADLEVAFS